MMLIEAKRSGDLQRKLRSLERIDLRLIDELGYTPFEREATDLLFNVISARYERSSSNRKVRKGANSSRPFPPL